MKHPIAATAVLATAILAAAPVRAVVFLNEVVVNPGGSYDNSSESIELLGTPGKKLDGYAIAYISGGVTKYFPLNSLPSTATADMEIDEFFSLDGLSLGDNGILVIGIGLNSVLVKNYPRLLDDSNFQRWNTIWNGELDDPGKLNNDGSATVLLIRNRPGITQADPTNTNGLLWGKDVNVDAEIIRPVIDPQDSMAKDQFGNGAIDKERNTENGADTYDHRGFTTQGYLADDLEIVDEYSVENDRGWELDVDSREVDSNSLVPGLPSRKVHAIDDPQGFNPDAFTRVDYRTKGTGYAPATGGTGDGPGGNNWQDTATEQWIRGETIDGEDEVFYTIFFYVNDANANPDAIQPYLTNVPLWLDDTVGTDYDFSQADTYEVMAGRINPLAVPFIPGDSDRDGDCDTDDIAKIAAVFGDDDWIFSNSFADAPEGKNGDPATQTRPWDVDATGDNGIEPSDLQWTLNFQGNTNGQIVGVQYDSTTPAATGVVLNSNAGTTCTVTTSVNVPSGHALNNLVPGDTVEITVDGQVTAGANATAGQENGIMQFVHDWQISMGGIARVDSVTPLASYATTRAGIQAPQGASGDLGIDRINGYTTSFAEGVATAAPLYRATLKIIGAGTADVTIAASADAKFAASTPHGAKLGHTDHNGNPTASAYPAAITLTAAGVPGDADDDGDVDLVDYLQFPPCMTGPGGGILTDCEVFDFDVDTDVDLDDYAAFSQLVN